MKKRILGRVLSSLIGLVFSQGNAHAGAPTFPVNFYKILSTQETEKNFVYSPYSIAKALELASFGARGDTLQQIDSAIHLKDFPTSPQNGTDQTFFVANRIWLQNDFKVESGYLNQCKKEADAEPGLVDFKTSHLKAASEINAWVEKQTHDKIKNLIPANAIKDTTRLILTNAIYFKAKWQSPFKKGDTSNDDFTLTSGKTVNVPFMHRKMHPAYSEDDQVQVLRLPYSRSDNTEYEMIMVLPKEDTTLAAFEKKLSPDLLQTWEKNLASKQVNITLPKFQFESALDLNESLKKIGIKDAFIYKSADFSGIDGKKDLILDQVFHKAFLSVDEDGTEAAAATAITMIPGAMMREAPPIEFSAKRPFFFYIQDSKTHTILFMGKLMNPKS